MIHDFVIIGGGVAGLSAAIHLAETGAKPLLIEAGTYPAHKICGEFFSPETLPILKRWGIFPPVLLHSVTFHAGSENFTFKLPAPAGSMTRYDFDAQLAQYAQKLGVIVLTNIAVTDIHRDNTDKYQLMLSSGQEVTAKSIIIGTGRVLGLIKQNITTSAPKYFGIKAHIQYNDLGDQVHFFSFPGAYLGISSVGHGVINLACLASSELVKKYPTTELFIRDLATKANNKLLDDVITHGTRLFPEWMTCYAPEFGIKNFPDMPNLYVIGDAAGTIPPASGDGLGIAITSGELLARYALKHDSGGFKKAWKSRYAPIINMGKLLHQIMSRPILAKLVIKVCSYAPSSAKKLFLKTRYSITQTNSKLKA